MGNNTRSDLVAIGTAVVNVADPRPPNEPRVSIFIRNSSAGVQIISLCFSDAQRAAVNYGVPLRPGEFILDSNSEGYVCFQGRITAISDVAAGQISIYER